MDTNTSNQTLGATKTESVTAWRAIGYASAKERLLAAAKQIQESALRPAHDGGVQGINADDALAIMESFGLGVSEDTAIIEWLEKRGGQLTCRKGFQEHHDGARFFAWDGMDEQYTGPTIRDMYRAAISAARGNGGAKA